MPTEILGSGQATYTNPTTGVYAAIAGYETTTPFNKTADTTLAAITDLGHPVLAGRTYTFDAVLWMLPDAIGGWKVGTTANVGTDTLVMSCRVEEDNGGGGGFTERLGVGQTILGDTSTNLTMWVKGIFICGTNGTFGLTFAQSVAAIGATSSVSAGMMWIKDTPGGGT